MTLSYGVPQKDYSLEKEDYIHRLSFFSVLLAGFLGMGAFLIEIVTPMIQSKVQYLSKD